MSHKINQQASSNISSKSSQKSKSTKLWQALTENEQEVTKGGFGFPGFPGGPALPGYTNNTGKG